MTLCAKLVATDGSTPVAGAQIVFTAVAGGLLQDGEDFSSLLVALTNAQGIATAVFVADGSAAPRVTAAYLGNPCGWEKTAVLLGRAVDVVFVIDRSGSMEGHEASYPAEASVQRFVREIAAVLPRCRFGAVMFNSQTTSRSLTQFAGANAVGAFCDWVSAFDADGSTTAPLAALQAAATDLETNARPGAQCLVVFVTDVAMDNVDAASRLAIVQRLDAITQGNGGGVFVSLWEDPDDERPCYNYYAYSFTDDPEYPSLAANGGFDDIGDWIEPPAVATEPRYLFNNLMDRLLGD